MTKECVGHISFRCYGKCEKCLGKELSGLYKRRAVDFFKKTVQSRGNVKLIAEFACGWYEDGKKRGVHVKVFNDVAE